SIATGACPSTASRQPPSRTMQKLGRPYSAKRTAHWPLPAMTLAKTARGCSRPTTCDRGSPISGLLLNKCGRSAIDYPGSLADAGSPRQTPPREPPMQTILITGCSSGYGLAIARYFHARGWQVIATMRRPRAELFADAPGIRVLPLDVTDPASIAGALDAAGPVDVLVNNAGLGLFGAFEATPMAT